VTRGSRVAPAITFRRLALLSAVLAIVVLARAAPQGEAAHGSLRLAQQPYAGVRCPGPNSIACDRIGLAVWLVKPAVRLTATVAGKPIRMAIPSRVRHDPGGYYCARSCYFEGAVHPAGLLKPGLLHIRPDTGKYYWEGRHPRTLRVRLVAFYRNGTSASTTIRILLHPGWG
jgi:hypothetical protein